MPIASRRTLPSRPSPRSWPAYLVLGCVAASLGWLVHRHPFTAVPLGALFAGSVLAARLEKRRQARVAARRPNESICTFVRGFDYRHTDTRVIRAVHEELQRLVTFPVRAGDELEGDLRLDGDDLDWDIAPAVAHRTRRPLVNTERNPLFGRVRTVADLVAFFCAQPLG